MMERSQDGGRCLETGSHIHHGHAYFARLAWATFCAGGRAGDAHHAALCLDHGVIAGPLAIGASLSIAGDRTVDQPWVFFA